MELLGELCREVESLMESFRMGMYVGVDMYSRYVQLPYVRASISPPDFVVVLPTSVVNLSSTTV